MEPPVVHLDPTTQDPDGRGDRFVPRSETIVVLLPKAFYDDHVQRDLIAGNVEQELYKGYRVRMDQVVYEELISDADVFVSYGTAEMGEHMFGLVGSARATLRRLRAVTDAPWMAQED